VLLTLGGKLVQTLEIKESPPFDNWGLWPWLFSSLVVIRIGLAIDGYREARAANA
jgi:hypothetical protein